MAIEGTWRKSWRLLKAVVSLPFIIVGTVAMLIVFAVSFLWDITFNLPPDTRTQKSPHIDVR